MKSSAQGALQKLIEDSILYGKAVLTSTGIVKLVIATKPVTISDYVGCFVKKC